MYFSKGIALSAVPAGDQVMRLLVKRRIKQVGQASWMLPIVLSTICMFSGCSVLRRTPNEEQIVAARALSLRASDACQRGEWDEAYQLFDEAIEACPSDVQTRRRYSEALWLEGRIEEALVQMRHVVRLSAQSPESSIRYGEMLLQSNRLDEADAVCRQAVRRSPNDADALALQGDIWRASGQWDDALEVYHRALKLRPSFPRVQLAIAHIDFLRGQSLRCLATLAALQQDLPRGREPAESIWLEGLALKSLERYQDAATRFARLDQRNPPSASVLSELAECCWKAGDDQLAQKTVMRLRSLFPGESAIAVFAERIADDETQRR